MSTAEKKEPTFTLGEVEAAFGQNYGCGPDGVTPIRLALNALDDIRRTLYTASVLIGDDDEQGVGELITNGWYRAKAAIAVLEKIHAEERRAGGTGEEIREMASALASSGRPQ
ncbi:MAG TPA: hypothetical protein VHE30_26015 [Polyangiaceae bacterium]|nr:hypothetical protein [Polyangiaceae bacterium]